jgi:hypothetical protein
MTPIASAIHPRLNAKPPHWGDHAQPFRRAEGERVKAAGEPVGAERAQPHRNRGEQRAEGEKELQAGFLVFFLTRCGRFLP